MDQFIIKTNALFPKYIRLQLISQDLNMLKSNKSFSLFQKITSTTNTKSKLLTQHQPDIHSQLLLQSRVEQSPLLGLESQKSKLTQKSTPSSHPSHNQILQTPSTLPLSELILKDNGYDYLFCENREVDKLQQIYVQSLKQQKKQVEEMLDLITLHSIMWQSGEIKQRIQLLEKQVSRLRAQRKSKSPFHQYSEYLGEFQYKRKERLSGRLLLLTAQEKHSLKTHCDSKTPSLASTPVSPVSHYKLMVSPRNQKPSTQYSASYAQVLKQKMRVIKGSAQTLVCFNEKRVQQLQQQNDLYRRQISLLNSLMAEGCKREGSYRSTVGHFNSSASQGKVRQSRKALEECSSPSNTRHSRKSQMIKLISRARKQLIHSPRQEYYYRSGQ